MDIMFVEYQVFPEKRNAYLQWMADLIGQEAHADFYEGSAQPNLFVELWRGVDEQEAESFRRIRQDPQGPWSALAEFVPGGTERIRMWHFRSMSSPSPEVI